MKLSQRRSDYMGEPDFCQKRASFLPAVKKSKPLLGVCLETLVDLSHDPYVEFFYRLYVQGSSHIWDSMCTRTIKYLHRTSMRTTQQNVFTYALTIKFFGNFNLCSIKIEKSNYFNIWILNLLKKIQQNICVKGYSIFCHIRAECVF